MALPWHKLAARVNAAGRVRCEPGWRLERGWSQRLWDDDLWFVWAGRGTMRLRDRAIDLRPGVLLWMRPGGLYLGDQDLADRLGVTYIHFDLLDARGRPARLDGALPAEHREVVDVPYVDAMTRRIAQVHRNMMGSDAGTAGQAVADQLLRGLLVDIDSVEDRTGAGAPRGGTDRHHHQLVMRAAAKLSEDLTNAPSVAELARQAGCTPDHLTRLFGKVLGVSPQTYLVNARIHRAQQLLVETGLTVSEIAVALGYRDVYFFSRQFKQKTGSTPTAYRKSVT